MAAWQVLTEAELEAVIMATVRGQRAEGGATEAEILAAMDWARRVRIDGALLRLVLDGDALIEVDHERGVRFRPAGQADVTAVAHRAPDVGRAAA